MRVAGQTALQFKVLLRCVCTYGGHNDAVMMLENMTSQPNVLHDSSTRGPWILQKLARFSCMLYGEGRPRLWMSYRPGLFILEQKDSKTQPNNK